MNIIEKIAGQKADKKGVLPTTSGALYVGPHPDGKPRKCDTCIMWISKEKQCEIHAKNIMVTKDHICIHQDTPVFANGIWKKAPEVKKGDLVLTHKNRMRRVKRTMSRNFSGNAVRLKVTGLPSILLTPNHPVYVIRKRNKWKNEEGRCYAPSPYRDVCDPEWIAAGDLKIRDVALVSRRLYRPENKIRSVEFNSSPIDVNKDLAILMGYYAAEGGVTFTKTSAVVSFSFNISETDLISECESLVKNIFGLKTKVTRNRERNSTHVLIYSKSFGEWMARHGGHRSQNKKIPAWIMANDRELVMASASAAWRGDGYVGSPPSVLEQGKPGTASYTTVSETLANQMETILHDAGFSPSVQARGAYTPKDGIHRKPSYKVFVNSSDDFLPIQDFVHGNLNSEGSRRKQRSDGLWRMPIRQLENEFYDGPVFNFSVEEDESYTTIGATLHNCGYYVWGKPHPKRMHEPDGVELDPVDPKHSGLELVPDGTACRNCEYFKKADEKTGICQVVQTDAGKLATVEALGCCARWEKK